MKKILWQNDFNVTSTTVFPSVRSCGRCSKGRAPTTVNTWACYRPDFRPEQHRFCAGQKYRWEMPSSRPGGAKAAHRHPAFLACAGSLPPLHLFASAQGQEFCSVDARWALIDIQQRRILRTPPESLHFPFLGEVERAHEVSITRAAELEPMGDPRPPIPARTATAS